MVTSPLLEAFLACPVKCHLLLKGEVPAGTEYSAWAAEREESYLRESFRKLISQETGPDIASAEPGIWKHESWRFAIGKTVRTESWEAEIALIQRITPAGTQSRFVPIRFTAKSRLTASDKTMAAFEATRNGSSGPADAGGKRKKSSWRNPRIPARSAASGAGRKVDF